MGKKDKLSSSTNNTNNLNSSINKSNNSSTNTSPVLDSKDENKIQKKFHLDPSEKVLYVIKARKKHRNGTLSITQEHICFQSSLLGTSDKKLLAFVQIVKIENLDKNGGVKITTKTGKAITFHFKQNESVYFLIESQWEASGNQSGSRIDDNNSYERAITSASLHKHFQLPDTEYTIKELPCSLKSTVKVKHYGTLFITQNYFCFYSHFLTSTTKRVVKLRNITSIEKSKDKLISISTPTENYKFSTFINRDDAYDILEETYEKAKLNTDSLPATPVLRSRSNSFDGTNSGGSRRNSNSLDINKLQETLEKQKGHSRQNSDNNSYTPTFKRTHSRQNSENTNNTTSPTTPTLTTSTTTPTTLTTSTTTNNNTNINNPLSTPKSHSRQNSLNENTKTTTPTTNNNSSGTNTNPPPPQKLSERATIAEKSIPKPEPTKPTETQQAKAKYRTCCFGIF